MSDAGTSKNYFVEELEKLVTNNDRASLAALRRGLGKQPAESPERHWFVMPRLPKDL